MAMIFSNLELMTAPMLWKPAARSVPGDRQFGSSGCSLVSKIDARKELQSTVRRLLNIIRNIGSVRALAGGKNLFPLPPWQ